MKKETLLEFTDYTISNAEAEGNTEDRKIQAKPRKTKNKIKIKTRRTSMSATTNGTMKDVLANEKLEFIFVGGKGGVGKTTSSCALALQRAVQTKKPVLLVSTDPAHNLGDALRMEVCGTPTKVVGCAELDAVAGASLHALEIDPTAVAEKEFEEVVSGLQDEMVDFASGSRPSRA